MLRRPYDPRAKRFAASILIDEVRRLVTASQYSPSVAHYRVMVVEDADRLGDGAALRLEEDIARARSGNGTEAERATAKSDG